MLVIAIILTALSALVAVGNIGGCIGAYRNRQRGIGKGYSNVPLISSVLGLLGWLASHRSLGLWPFAPALFDPGTWMCLYLPWMIWNEFVRRKTGTKLG